MSAPYGVILSEEDRPLAGDADESKDPYELICRWGFLELAPGTGFTHRGPSTAQLLRSG